MKHDYSDPMSALREHADHLNAICRPGFRAQVFYELMTGGLMWRDETNSKTPGEVVNSLRLIIAYRTSLMLDEPRTEFSELWDEGLYLFPKWIGFRLDRRTPSPKLMEIYRRGNVSMKKCIRDWSRVNELEDEH